MTLESGETSLTTRRATVARGGLAATLAALFSSGFGIIPLDAKKKKKKRKKKKKKPPVVVARLEAADMTDDKEVPGPGDSGASGSATFDIKSNGEICGDFDVMNLDAGSIVTLTHIHQGAAGAQGPPVVDFQGQTENCVKPGQAILDQIIANPAGFYANLHTDNFPDGAVRDQLSAIT